MIQKIAITLAVVGNIGQWQTVANHNLFLFFTAMTFVGIVMFFWSIYE